MRLLLAALSAVLALAAAPAVSPQPPSSPLLSKRAASERPTLMVLGMIHLANNNRDVHNARVDDVLAPARQAQIERLVTSLAAWKPTRIAVEWPRKAQAALDQRYADYCAGRLALTANERDQIGLRLAARLNLPRVDAVDWNESPPGAEADYDWEIGAKAAGEEARLAALKGRKTDEDLNRLVATHSVAGFLRIVNQPEYLAGMNLFYYDIALLGPPEANVGANWVGSWYARNLKIFSNLVRLDAKPSDRVLVLYGAGHGHFLNLFAEDSRAFRLVRPDAALARAEKPS